MAMFTAEELEELKRIDEEIDREDLTHEDYMLEELVEDILFPEKAAARKKLADYRKKKRETVPAEERKRKAKEAYAKKDKEAEKARKRAWYLKNKEKIMAQQRDYRIRTGKQKATA